MKTQKIIVPIIISLGMLVCNSALAQTENTVKDTAKVEKTPAKKVAFKFNSKKVVKTANINTGDSKTTQVNGTEKTNTTNDPQKVVPVESEKKPLKGEEKKATELNNLKKEE